MHSLLAPPMFGDSDLLGYGGACLGEGLPTLQTRVINYTAVKTSKLTLQKLLPQEVAVPISWGGEDT